MPVPHFRIGALVIVGLLLMGCSATQIAYENADSLLTRYAARKLDLDTEQRERLSARLGEWLLWHRAEQLPIFHTRLSAVQRAIADGIDLREANWLITTVRGSYKEAITGLIPITAETLATLSDEQIATLSESFSKENEAFREDVLAGDSAKRRDDRFEWFRERLERWLGDLNPEQLEWLRVQLRRYPSTAEPWLRYREQQQGLLLNLLRDREELTTVVEFLRGWMIERRGLPDLFSRSRQRLYAELPHRVVELDRMLTPRQRQHLAKRIQFFDEVVANLILVPEARASTR